MPHTIRLTGPWNFLAFCGDHHGNADSAFQEQFATDKTRVRLPLSADEHQQALSRLNDIDLAAGGWICLARNFQWPHGDTGESILLEIDSSHPFDSLQINGSLALLSENRSKNIAHCLQPMNQLVLPMSFRADSVPGAIDVSEVRLQIE